MAREMEWIGRSIPRIGAQTRARGKALFGGDVPLEGPLILKLLRSPRPHARILSINTERAMKNDGVEAIFTAKDIPGRNLIGLITKDQPLLAHDKVRFVGEPVALVAARDEESAIRGVEEVEVVYEDLPAIFTPDEALDPGAVPIHEKGNLLHRRVVVKGDVEDALSRAHLVVERTYSTPFLEHACLEPDAGWGYVDKDGTLVIVASTQNPHYDQREVAELLGVEKERVRVIQAATGGGFGSKLDLTVQGFIGLALYHLRRPVKLTLSREEVFLATPKRHAMKIWMRTAARRDGRLLALEAKIICDTGAYSSYGVAVATRAAVHATGPYEIENVRVESLAVYTNNPIAGAMRGFGVPQVAFAHESQMDILAESLGIDPLEIRRINAMRPESVTATGQVLGESVGLLEALDAVEPHYREAMEEWKKGPRRPYTARGVGLGAMWYGIGNTGVRNPSTVKVQLDERGRVVLYIGAADMGQGSTTVLVQMASETLGISPEEMEVVIADTGLTPDAGASSASRQTYISGNALVRACRKLSETLLEEASRLMGLPRGELVLRGGNVVSKEKPERRVSLAELAALAKERGVSLEFEGHFDPETTPLDPSTGQGIPYATYSFACQMAQVEVDLLTGQVEVRRIVAAHDVGKAINPKGVVGQIRGGVAMGVGFALMEEFLPGSTRSFKDYHIPTAADMPEVIPIIVESSEPTGPFGAKGVGEPALIPTAPAILNAIADALGERIYALPATLERVCEASIRAGWPKMGKGGGPR
jgi:CO/xanthine dehydrogenase Mo-binding subunit